LILCSIGKLAIVEQMIDLARLIAGTDIACARVAEILPAKIFRESVVLNGARSAADTSIGDGTALSFISGAPIKMSLNFMAQF
jgi:hypothetical protein